MDRRQADKNLRAGLVAASVAAAVFALSFVVAIYWLA